MDVLDWSYSPSYFEIDDILATEQTVKCQLNVEIKDLGFLNLSNNEKHLTVGSTIDLPLWLALEMYPRYVNVTLPPAYRNRFRKVLEAGAASVDLRQLQMYFYETGSHILKFEGIPERSDVWKTLLMTFKTRFSQLFDSAQNASHEDVTSLSTPMDALEKKLFHRGYRTALDHRAWLKGDHASIEVAQMVVNYRKRTGNIPSAMNM